MPRSEGLRSRRLSRRRRIRPKRAWCPSLTSLRDPYKSEKPPRLAPSQREEETRGATAQQAGCCWGAQPLERKAAERRSYTTTRGTLARDASRMLSAFIGARVAG